MSDQPNYFNSIPFFDSLQYSGLPNHIDLIVVAWQLKTPENIGSLIRLAANMGLKEIILVNEESETKRETKINKIARSSLNYVRIKQLTPDSFGFDMLHDYTLVSLETCQNSTNIFNTALPDKMALFVGNEITGLPPSVVSKTHHSVHIPLPGEVKSMNVSHAATVAAFEWYRQKMWQQ